MAQSTTHALHVGADSGLPWTWYAIKEIRFPTWVPQYVKLLNHFWNLIAGTFHGVHHAVHHNTMHQMLKQSLYYMFLKAVERNSVEE